jgi:hypothetical protein
VSPGQILPLFTRFKSDRVCNFIASSGHGAPHNRAGTDGAMLFHGVDNSVGGEDKHLTHLSPAADCCLKERIKQNIPFLLPWSPLSLQLGFILVYSLA